MDAQFEAPLSLTILSLSAPFLDQTAQQQGFRTSNASSTDSHSVATPAVLAADLAHYQDLFSKLRFSYVEQVTKERFLRAITAQHPEFVETAENAVLEEQLGVQKAALKDRKELVRDMVLALEEQGRSLAGRYELAQLQTIQLDSLPFEINNLEATVAKLQENRLPKSNNPALCLPLQATVDRVAHNDARIADIDARINALQASLPQKQARLTALQSEVDVLQTRKRKAVEEAKEARRRREGGGIGDDLDERGRWLGGVEVGLRTMVQA